MLRFPPRWFGWLLALTLGLWAVAAHAQEFRYHYVSLDRLSYPQDSRSSFHARSTTAAGFLEQSSIHLSMIPMSPSTKTGP